MGKGEGVGIGRGAGPGVGGRDGAGTDPSQGKGRLSDPDVMYSPREVDVKARIISKPEAQFTEEARNNDVSGRVVLKAVLSATGQVTMIRVVSGLPYGLSQKAVEAARMIKFIPATKDGQAISQVLYLEYNFNPR